MALLGVPLAAAVTSWGSSGDFVYQLTTYQSFQGFVYAQTGNTWNGNTFGGGFDLPGAGLRETRFTLNALVGAKLDGYNGLLTFSSGDALHINGYEINISRPLFDNVTPFGQQNKKWRPGKVGWSGTITGHIDDTTPPKGALLSGGWGSATFQLQSSGTGKQLTGNVNYTLSQGSFEEGSPAEKTYNFIGSDKLASVGSATNILWAADSNGTLLSGIEIDKVLTLTLNTGVTVYGAAYWSDIRISARPGSPISITVDGMFSDTVTGL